MIDISTSPVKYRHEVVANTMYALFSEVCQRLFIYFYLLVSVLTTIFYCFCYRKRLYDTPFHAVALDIFLEVTNLFT